MLGAPPKGWSDSDREESSRPFYWTPACSNCGHEFIVLGFLEPVYVMSIEVYELFSPGAVVRLSVASDYDGNRTDWHTLWSGFPKAVDSPPRVFSPDICPDTSVHARWLRVDILTNTTSQVNMFVGAAVYGNTADASDWVYDSGDVVGRLLYVPTPGVTVAAGVDSFDIATSDCSTGESGAVQVAVPAFDPVDPAAHFGEPIALEVSLGATMDVEVSLNNAAEHLSAALGHEVDQSEFEIELQPSACFDIMPIIDGDDATFLLAAASQATLVLDSNEEGRLPCAATENEAKVKLPSGPSFSVRPGSGGVREGSFALFATARNVTYRLLVEATVVCPPGGSPTQCAAGPEDCEDGQRFELLEGLCAEVVVNPMSAGGDHDDIASSTIALIIVGAVIVVLLLVAGLLLYHYNGIKASTRSFVSSLCFTSDSRASYLIFHFPCVLSLIVTVETT
jgi:hypothetical protein